MKNDRIKSDRIKTDRIKSITDPFVAVGDFLSVTESALPNFSQKWPLILSCKCILMY
jgi:hypothetical protein